MNETKWKQVSAAECLKWQIDNPMKEAAYGSQQSGRQRYNDKTGQFEILFEVQQEWVSTEYPGCDDYTYFIPEVTE
jgi:hypothetical protein